MSKPIIKWAGSKRQLLTIILPKLPININTYYEPFCGGSSLFFKLADNHQFNKAVINDINVELITTYKVLQSGRAEELINLLKTYPYNSEFYYNIRSREPTNPIEIAARFVFLNKAGFNG